MFTERSIMKRIVSLLLIFNLCMVFPKFLFGINEYSGLPYERFVSLGNVCATRTQINEHLKKRFGLDPYVFGGGQIFDWLIIRDIWKAR